MAYIIFVNPAILEKAGMDYGAVFVATCRAASRTLGHHGALRQLSDRPRAGHGAQRLFRLYRGRRRYRSVPCADRAAERRHPTGRFKEINAAVAVVALAFLFKLILA
jgi:hypothetical protein